MDDKAHEAATKAGARVRFWYGSDGARYKREDDGGTRTTLYLGNVEVVTVNGVTKFKRTIAGVMLQTSTSPTEATDRYLFHDHLGNLIRVTDAAGVVVTQMDFLAFGARRDFSDPGIGTSSVGSPTTRGFTGHEMIDGALQMIHMNGRVFDSGMGRFLQADPLIQAPENAQSWNAYTYVFNNPYRYTDPTGMLGQTERQWLAVVVAIVYTYFTWDLEGGAAILAAAFGGMVTGAIATGNMYGAMPGALIGAITAGIGVGAAAEGIGPWTELGIRAVSGGIMEVIQGGNFGHGFAAAGLTAMLMPDVRRIDSRLVRTAVGAIVGGSISAATGGKFANGAITGAVMAAVSGSPAENEGDYSYSARHKNEAGEFETSEPKGLEELRRAYPQLQRKMDSTMAASSGDGLFNMAEEKGFYAFVNRSSQQMKFFDMPDAEWSWASQTFGRIPSHSLPKPGPGYDLAVVFHTHPFEYGFGKSLPFSGKVLRGPSHADHFSAAKAPQAYSVVQSPSEYFYFGRATMGGKP